jgi:uncharacterized membrane protein YfcA
MESAIHLTLAEFVVALMAVAVGSVVQGSVGFGANLIAVPVLAVLEPEALPATLTLAIVPLAIGMARRESHGVDWPGVRWVMSGRLPGTVIGAVVVASVAGDTLSVLAGCGVLLAVAMSVVTTNVPMTPGSTVAAGVASGAMGTATAIGGPPLALLYQHHEGPVVRATLAVTFGIGTVLSIAGLLIAHAVAGWHIALAAALLPGTLAGLWVSSRVTHRIDGPWLRPTILTFAALAATVAVARGLM